MHRRQWLGIAGLAAGVWLGRGLIQRFRRLSPAWLRPPGALPEPDFSATCIRCGQCVEACPFDTLYLAGAEAGLDYRTPTLDTRKNPCWLCKGYEELLCIEACPTGSLAPVADVPSIRMGIAEIDRDLCLAWNQVSCRACWHACPLPDRAIVLDERVRPIIDPKQCIGCGLCDYPCLTEPTSVWIWPEQEVTDLRADL
ncbi:MAG: 4Fe-4S dicluster domain-containing protein [Planctomycetota bacterium]|nr:MAG: 4Fe-4S dicluster domain-containing protein [Planctomycetota bacterium]